MVFIVHPIEPEGVQPEGAGLRADPRRHDALQGRLAQVAAIAPAPMGRRPAPAGGDGARPVSGHRGRVLADPPDAGRSGRRHDGGVRRRHRQGALRRELGSISRSTCSTWPGWADCARRSRALDPQPASRCIEDVGRAHPSEPRAGPARHGHLARAWRSRSASLGHPPQHARVDSFGTTFALFGICMPNFLIALLLIFVFGVTLRWLPISGYSTRSRSRWRHPLADAAGDHPGAGAGRGHHAHAALEHAGDASEDYVRTARAKGLAEGRSSAATR